MAHKRKTIEVQTMLEFANYQLARTDIDATKEYKFAVIGIIEKILLETKNYNGFCFINNNDCEFNTLGYTSRKYF